MDEIDDSSASQVIANNNKQRLSFTGSGLEYFGIWIVNLLLTIATLGIYSAWAKVRKTRYFYHHTQLAGSSFEYHGNPIAILKGRIVAIVLLAGYQFAFQFSALLGVAMGALLMVVLPLLLWKSLQFRTWNSSYRGIRFGFRGSKSQAYTTYLLWTILSVFTLYLLLPFAHHRIKKFQHTESRFGSTFFSFDATVGAFYRVYLSGLLIAVIGGIGFGVLGGAVGGLSEMTLTVPRGALSVVAIALSLYLWLVLFIPIFLTMIQNLIWNHTRLGAHEFRSEMKWGKMAFISLSNFIGIVFTLGLFVPFAQIRSRRYRIESMSLIPRGSLDDFVAETQAEPSATGEGAADFLDFDLSL